MISLSIVQAGNTATWVPQRILCTHEGGSFSDASAAPFSLRGLWHEEIVAKLKARNITVHQ